MNTYLLLRDNHETGPHTLEELKALSLRNLDLIWVEGKSEHWDYATEFGELKPFIVASPKNPRRSVALMPTPSVECKRNQLPLQRVALVKTPELSGERGPAAFALRSSTEELVPAAAFTERPADVKSFHFPERRNRSGSLWILSLLLMLMFGAFVVKKLVDDRAQEALVQSAYIALAKKEMAAQKEATALTFQHAISKEEVAVSKKKAAKKIDLEAVKSKVRLATNDYKIKLLGGVNDLQINVTNGSGEALQTVGVEIKFLKRNGKVIRTENYSVYAIGPHATKTLVVPPTKRGVKVQYKVTDVTLITP